MPLNNPLLYGCPACWSAKGDRCINLETGDLMVGFHSERQMLAIPRAVDHARGRMDAKPKLSDRLTRGS